MRTYTWPTQVGASQDVGFRAGENEFGDGYTQRYTIGLRPKKETWTLAHVGDKDDIPAIKQFIDDHRSIFPFWWTPPLSDKPIAVVCPGYKSAYAGQDVQNLAFVFNQYFGPELENGN